jgi:hypothetical protein
MNADLGLAGDQKGSMDPGQAIGRVFFGPYDLHIWVSPIVQNGQTLAIEGSDPEGEWVWGQPASPMLCFDLLMKHSAEFLMVQLEGRVSQFGVADTTGDL